MRQFLEFLCLSAVVIASSCNIDEVITAQPLPKIIIDGSGTYRTYVGDPTELAPRYESVEDGTFSWTIDDIEVCRDKSYTYTAKERGTIHITLTVTTPSGSDSKIFRIEAVDRCYVYDYTPAPGQFIGDMKSAGFDGLELTEEDVRAYAERQLLHGQLISLGAFGGYIVVGFDYTIPNRDGYDFAITGNAFKNSSEPGVVWVMQDLNGNGLPDDIWYELCGSETGKRETIQSYEVTYYRPTGAEMSVAWSDNIGGHGEVEYLKTLHDQPSYYPTWITGSSYTLCGTRLQSRSYDSSENGSMWINPSFDWGYADNASTVDSSGRENFFDISNAIDDTLNSITLKDIDFIKVQSAIQQQCGWVGELSTEVLGFRVIDNE